MNLKEWSFIQEFNNKHIILIFSNILIAIIVAVSYFFVPVFYAPLFLLGGCLAIYAIITCFKKPVWALYIALFTLLLPNSLIPAQINSYTNRITSILALVVWVVYVVRENRKVILTKSTLFMIFFTLWAAITLLWAENFDYGSDIFQRYVLRLILFLLLFVNEISTEKKLTGLMNTLALSGILLIGVSGVSILTQGYTSGTRLSVLNVNENNLGLSLLISLQGVLWWVLRPSRHSSLLKKILGFTILSVSIGIIGLSGSRGTALSLIVTLGVFILWRPTRFWGLIGFFIIGCGLVLAPIFFSTTIARFLGTTGESALGGREVLWVAGWNLIRDNFLTGVGVGNSSSGIIPYLTTGGGIDLSLLRITWAPVHNPILAIWADTGIIGLFLYLMVFISAIISFLKNCIVSIRKRNRYLLSYNAIVSSVFIGYLLSWIKGGGMESDFSYFLMLALLWIPSYVQFQPPEILFNHEKN